MLENDVRPVRFGIVGCGLIADVHAHAIAATTGARLVGVASRSREKALRFAAKHGVGVVCDTVGELVSRPEIEVIIVTTPSGSHLEPVLAAAKAGKHVLVEKPLEVTLERIDRMIHACEAAGVKLAAVFQARFGPDVQHAKRAIDSGRLGRLTLCDARVKWFRSQEYYSGSSWHGTKQFDGGGSLMNQSIHAIDLLQWLMGMPMRVGSFKGMLGHAGLEVEDTAVAILHFPSGALGVVEGTTAAWPGFARRIEISGMDGTVILEDERIVCWRMKDPVTEDEEIVAKIGLENKGQGSGFADPAIDWARHALAIHAMANAVRENSRPVIDGREGRNAVALIEAFYRSAETGSMVDIPGYQASAMERPKGATFA